MYQIKLKHKILSEPHNVHKKTACNPSQGVSSKYIQMKQRLSKHYFYQRPFNHQWDWQVHVTVFYGNVGQLFLATLFTSLSTSIDSFQQPLMSSSITGWTHWQKPCQEDLKRRPQSTSPTAVSMPGFSPCHAQSSCPQDWKTGRGQLLCLSTICLQEARVASARGNMGHHDQRAGP